MKNYNYEDDDNIKNLNINESIESNNKKLFIQGGIDPERIINKEYLSSLGDFYKCSICFKIMISPKDCEECGHSYCYECISILNCPFGCKTKSIKNTSAGIINLLKNLKFKCQNEGCATTIPYAEVKNHDLNCEYQKVFCTNKKCKKRLIKKDLDNHVKNICKYSLINCQYCKNDYYRKEITEHEKLCLITYKYLENYKKGKNVDDINEIISQYDNINLNEKYFKKYLKDLSSNISKILQENTVKKESIYVKDNNKNEEIEQNEIKNNNNLNNNSKIDESKDSIAQLDEGDLLDFINMVLEKRLKKQFEKYDFNIFEFCQLLNIIKGCVCQLNTIEEVQESDEDESEEKEINTNINDKNNKTKTENINIKDALKKFIDESETKIKECLSQLNDSILLKIKNDKIEPEPIKIEEKKITIRDINKNIDTFITQINNCIKDSNTNLLNIYQQIDETKNINNSLINKDSHKNNIKLQIKNILENIIQKSKCIEINDIIKNKNQNIIEIYEEKNNLIKSELNKSLNEKNEFMNQEILKLNKEIEQTKGFIKDIKALIIEQTNNVSNKIKNQLDASDNTNTNLVEKIVYNAFNQPNIYVRSRINPIKTIQPNKLNLPSMNINIDKNIKSYNRAKSSDKKSNSTKDNLPFVNLNKKYDKYMTHSHSSNSLYFRDSIRKSIYIDNGLVEQILRIENKIKSIYNNIKLVPEKVDENIYKDVMNYFSGLKEFIDKNLEGKIKDKFKPKFCEECQKVECFYCFKRCYNCKIEFCLNNIILCRNCKNFFCKECYQKSHKCI